MSRPRKNPKKSQNICTWIRQRTSPYDHGVKTRKGNPAHVNRNDDVRYHFQCLEAGWYGRRLSRLTNADMFDHFDNKKTFYFTADGRSATPEALINIDIDCHGFGSLAGAIAFAEHLRKTRFPNLYYEVSTNGNGVHGFIVVEKGDLGDEGLNGALTMLDRWLKAELSRGDWDVENVEVKGHCPEFTWGMKKFELRTYKSGQLAKLPREALTRADELRGTTRIAVDELRRLKVSMAAKASDDSFVLKVGRATKAAVVVEEDLKSAVVESGDSVVLNIGRATKKSAVVGAEKKVSGSISGHHFGEDELSKLGGCYLSLAKELIGETKLVATGRKVVTAEDLAVFLMLLKFFSLNMNADGSLPTARWREMWRSLHEAGDVERGWCHHRFARMRNYLSDEGLLSWEDEDFVVGVHGDDGRFVPGKAAKWRASKDLLSMMEEVEAVEQVDVVVDQEEKKEEEKTILYGCKVKSNEHDEEKEEEMTIIYAFKYKWNNDNDNDEEKEEEKTILYGCTPTVSPEPSPDPGQSESYFKLLDSLNLWTPIPRPRFAGYSTGQFRLAA